jgi:hypothetical protein
MAISIIKSSKSKELKAASEAKSEIAWETDRQLRDQINVSYHTISREFF